MSVEAERNREFDFEVGINNVDEILDMNPRTLAAFMKDVEAQGQTDTFLKHAVQDNTLVAHLSYWEKWFPESIRRQIDARVAEHRGLKGIDPDALPMDLDKKFTPEELEILFSHKGAFQLTFGCSKGCKHCGLDAVPGVRDEMNFEQMENLFKQYGEQIGASKWMLYYASEPADSDQYSDYHKLMEQYGHYNPEILTAEGRKKEWIDYLVKNTRLDVRMSLPEEGKYGYGRLNKARERYETVLFDGKEITIAIKAAASIKEHIQQKKHIKNIGVSYSPEYTGETRNKSYGIGCICGALITPRGIYNVAQVPISEEFPQGQIVVPIKELSDETVKVGQHLKEILSTSIIYGSNMIGNTRRWGVTSIIHRKDADYLVKTDAHGFITEVKAATSEEKEELFPRTSDMQKLETIYEERKKKALSQAKLCKEDKHPAAKYIRQVHEVVSKNPSLLRLSGTSRHPWIGRVEWEGEVELPGVPGTFWIGLNYGYGSNKSNFRIHNDNFRTRAEISLDFKRVIARINDEERKEYLVRYLQDNIVEIIKNGEIKSFNQKPFDYQKLLEDIAKLDFGILEYSGLCTKPDFIGGEFPDSLYEGQPDECKKKDDEESKDRISICFQTNGEINITISDY